MIVARVGEVSIVKERLDTHERLAAMGRVATPEEIEGYQPEEDIEDEREAWRTAMLNRVFRIIPATRETDESADVEAEYSALITKFADMEKADWFFLRSLSSKRSAAGLDAVHDLLGLAADGVHQRVLISDRPLPKNCTLVRR